MNFFKQKYNNKTSVLILTGYLLAFSVGIFHFHTLDFNFTKAFDADSGQRTNHFQNLNGKANECFIQQNLSKIQTAVTRLFKDQPAIKQLQTSLFFYKAFGKIIFKYHSANQLRAPPKIY